MGWREKSRLLVVISSVSVLLIGFVLANRPLSDSLHSASSNSRSNRILFPDNTVDLAKASQNPLKNLLNLLTKNRGSHSENATSLLNQLLANDGNSTSVNNTLAYLYRLGNETNYFKNLTALQEIMNRTSRGYGGGGWGGMGGGYGGGKFSLFRFTGIKNCKKIQKTRVRLNGSLH